MDAGFGLRGFGEHGRGQVAEGGVSPDSVVEDFDGLEEALTRCVAALVLLVMHEFFLQGGEERSIGALSQ